MRVTAKEMEILQTLLEHKFDRQEMFYGTPCELAMKLLQLWLQRKVHPDEFELMPDEQELPGTEDMTDPLAKKPKGMPSLPMIKAEAARLGLQESDAEYMFENWLANGFRTKSGPIKDWRAAMSVWNRSKWFPSQKTERHAKPTFQEEITERMRKSINGR